MTLFLVALVFLGIMFGIIYLSNIDKLSGLKTKIVGGVTAAVGIIQANLPDAVGNMFSNQTMAWIFVGLGLTAIVARSVSK